MLNCVDPVSLEPGPRLVLVIHLETHGTRFRQDSPSSPQATNASCCLATESPAQSYPLILPRPCFSHQPTSGAGKPPLLSTTLVNLYSSLSTHHSWYLLLRLRCLEVLGEIQDQSRGRPAWGRTWRKWDRKFPAPSLSGKGDKEVSNN